MSDPVARTRRFDRMKDQRDEALVEVEHLRTRQSLAQIELNNAIEMLDVGHQPLLDVWFCIDRARKALLGNV